MKPYKTMTLRLNATEYAHLCRQAEVTGLKKEPLVRQLIMGVNLRPRPPDAYAELLRALSAIGNNINQIAKKANEINSIYASDIEDLKENYEDICHTLNLFLSTLPSTAA